CHWCCREVLACEPGAPGLPTFTSRLAVTAAFFYCCCTATCRAWLVAFPLHVDLSTPRFRANQYSGHVLTKAGVVHMQQKGGIHHKGTKDTKEHKVKLLPLRVFVNFVSLWLVPLPPLCPLCLCGEPSPLNPAQLHKCHSVRVFGVG